MKRHAWPVPLTALATLAAHPAAAAPGEGLPSWNEGPAKRAIVQFVQTTTDPASPQFVPPAERIATFDQDGTLWVEQPIYSQVIYCLERVPALVKTRPQLATQEPFKTVLAGDGSALVRLTKDDLMKVLEAALAGMSVEEFRSQVRAWLEHARDPRWQRKYTELTYLPMQELMRYLRANGYRTYIVTGGGQAFVRVFAEETYGIPPEQVVGSAGGTSYGYDDHGNPVLTKEAKLVLMDDNVGKPQGIELMIGRRPHAAFGNSVGDRQMLEYTTAGKGARLAMLVLHDDATREYAYGPARGLPESRVGSFPAALDEEAQKKGWIVISMKEDWRQIFAFER